MTSRKGIFIVIEGSDGSGKATQFNLLSERLKAAGYDVSVFDFPRYDKDSAYFVKQYLNGRYGSATELSPYISSLFYALDRFEASKDIKAALNKGHIVISNRYVGSNMAHQGSKLADPAEQRGFFVWNDNLEFELLKIPRPDLNIFLRVPAEVSQKLMEERSSKTGIQLDEHEKNGHFLEKALMTYDLLCELFPKDFTAIECFKNGQLSSIPAISNLIWDKVRPMLPADKPHQGRSAIVTLGQPARGQDQPKGDDADKLEQKFSSASLLLKLAIERQLKSVEPSGFSMWSDSDYQYYVPQGLSKDLTASYKQSMDRIAELHKQMRQKLEHHYESNLFDQTRDGLNTQPISALLLPATPLAALCSFDATLSQKSVERVSKSLLAQDSEELQWAAKQLYLSARHMWPSEFSGPLESNTAPEPLNNIIAKLAEDKFSFNSADNQDVKLLEALPRQEFDLLADTIYPYSNLSLNEITEEIADWSYKQKYDSLKQAAANPKTILDKIIYKFDLISDQLVMEEVIGSILTSNVQYQAPSPRNGYEVPTEIEEAGIDDLYIECFDESLKLYSVLQNADNIGVTDYASLLGHKLRWQLNVNATQIKMIIDKKGGSSYAKLIDSIKEKLAEAHPLTWEVLSGVSASALNLNPVKKNRVKPAHRRRSKSKRPTKPSDK